MQGYEKRNLKAIYFMHVNVLHNLCSHFKLNILESKNKKKYVKEKSNNYVDVA